MIVFLHAALFVVLSSFRPTSVMSLLHASFHRRFGRPLLLFTGMSTSNILLTMCSSFILLTWPYHFSRFSVIFLDACTSLVPLMCSFRILSLLVTLHIHLCILISFTSSHVSCPFVVAQVTAPYNRAGLTTVLETFPFSFTGILLSYNTSLHLFQFPHAALTLCEISVVMPIYPHILVRMSYLYLNLVCFLPRGPCC